MRHDDSFQKQTCPITRSVSQLATYVLVTRNGITPRYRTEYVPTGTCPAPYGGGAGWLANRAGGPDFSFSLVFLEDGGFPCCSERTGFGALWSAVGGCLFLYSMRVRCGILVNW